MQGDTPVILVHSIDTALVDEVAAVLAESGRYRTLNAYNEKHAMDAVRQYERGFGLLTSRLGCIITDWNPHRRPRDQFLYRLRDRERRSPFRRLTPVMMVAEDHRRDLVDRARDPDQGAVTAYLDRENFRQPLLRALDGLFGGTED